MNWIAKRSIVSQAASQQRLIISSPIEDVDDPNAFALYAIGDYGATFEGEQPQSWCKIVAQPAALGKIG
jgi:hypothetical protein